MESAATGGDDESLADEKLGQQTGRKQQEWWLGLGILVDIGEGRQGQVWQEWWRRKAGLPLYRARERERMDGPGGVVAVEGKREEAGVLLKMFPGRRD